MFRTGAKTEIRLKGIVLRILECGLNILFPNHCSCCRKVLPITQKPPYLCLACLKLVSVIPLKICPSCGKPLDITGGILNCPYCVKNDFPFTFFVSPLPYDKTAREMVLNLKFHSTPSAAKTLAYFIHMKLKKLDILTKCNLLVPAPIGRKRKLKRGYNQSELICKYLSRLTGIPYANALKKIKDTPPQSTLSFRDRAINLEGAIIADPGIDIHKNIILVDDVFTTGSTLSLCSKILKANGALSVYAVCACRTENEDEEKK